MMAITSLGIRKEEKRYEKHNKRPNWKSLATSLVSGVLLIEIVLERNSGASKIVVSLSTHVVL